MTPQNPESELLSPATIALLDAAGLRNKPLRKSHTSLAVPLLVFLARLTNTKKIDDRTRHIKDLTERAKEESRIEQELIREGNHWTKRAEDLSHRKDETTGEFAFEREGASPNSCLLCGADDHVLDGCEHFLHAYRKKQKIEYNGVLPEIDATENVGRIRSLAGDFSVVYVEVREMSAVMNDPEQEQDVEEAVEHEVEHEREI